MLNQSSRIDFFVLVTLITSILSTVTSSSLDDSWFGPEFNVIQKLYDDCQDKNDFTGCLKGKALTALSNAIEQDTISVIDGVSFEKQNQTLANETPSITDARSLVELSGIDRTLMLKLDRFLRTHVVKFDMSEGRDKKHKKAKKLHRLALAAMITAMSIAVPVGLKIMAIIAGKALIISNVALTIAGIIAMHKLYKSEHHEETSVQVHADSNRRTANFIRNAKQPIDNTGYGGQIADPYRQYLSYQTARPFQIMN